MGDDGARSGVGELASTHLLASLDCLFSAQAELLDVARPGSGGPFLFASSLYCAYGHDGFYVDHRDKGHTRFLSDGLPVLLGYALRCVDLGPPAGALKALLRLLDEGVAVIVPVNLRFHPRFRSGGMGDFPYPVILVGRRADGFLIRDNLDRDESSSIWPFGESVVTGRELESMLRGYTASGLALEWMTGAPECWALRLRETERGATRRRAVEPIAVPGRWIVDLYRRATDASRALDTGRWVEARHWAALTGDRGEVTGEEPEVMAKRYLRDVNFAEMHFEVLVRAVAASQASIEGDIREMVQRAQAHKRSLRMRLLVDVLAGRLAASARARDITELVAIDPALRLEMLQRLDDPGGCESR